MVEIYKLTNNQTNEVYTYYSNNDTVYRDEIKLDGKEDDLIVYFDSELEPFNSTILYPNYENFFTIEIFQNTLDNLIYSGYISEIEYDIDKGIVKVTIYSMLTFLSQNLFLYRYQINCPYRLYGSDCGVNKENHKFIFDDITIDGNKIIINSGTGQDYGYFTGGFIKTDDNKILYIMNDYNNTFYLSFNINFLSNLQSITAYPGCSKTEGDCTNKFNNFNRFGGFPLIPNVDPSKDI